MNPVLEDRYARVLHFLIWKAPLPHYLAKMKIRVVANRTESEASLYSETHVRGARVADHVGLLLFTYKDKADAMFEAGAIQLLGEEPVHIETQTGPALQFLGPLGLLSYRATWRTRLKHQKVRQPW